MDQTPEKNYRPEDEYEELEFVPKQLTADEKFPDSELTKAENETSPAQQRANDLPPYRAAFTQPQQPAPQQPAPQPVAPQPNTPPVPAAPAPYYPGHQQPYYYPQQVQPIQQPMQPPMPQPIQPPVQQPMQQPPYGYGYPPVMPVYPQAPQPKPAPVQPVQPAAPAPNPYTPQPEATPTATAPEKDGGKKQPMHKGTMAYLIILTALLVAMIVGFAVYVSHLPKQAPKGSNHGSTPDTAEHGILPDTPEDIYNDLDNGDFTEVEKEITLVEDKGETQNREDDKDASKGKPDEKAKSITFAKQPADKEKNSGQYTAQSAYDTVSDSVVTVMCYTEKITDNAADVSSQGTGTVISSDGYIVTNAHVIGNSKAYLVNIVFNNGDKYPAKIVGYDTWSDLAVLKIDAKDLKAVTFGDSELVKVGEDIITVGSPGGEAFKNSLTKGVVSAVDRELSVNKYVRYIQCDAAISPGNSGGPLCNLYGQVIGITTAKAVADYYENMSFSIPSATVKTIVNDLMHFGYVKGRVRIGLTGTEVGAQGMYYDIPSGVIISSIDENGSLADSGIKTSDILTELDGETITSFQDIYNVLAKHKPGDKVTIKVQRPTD